jgi:anti-sigma B factor antagonist
MRLDVEYVSGIAVLIVKEGLTGDESGDLVPTVQQIVDEGTRLFVVDLSDSGKIDSSGIGNLVKAYTVVAKQNGRMVIVRSSKFLNSHLLGIPQLISVFEMYQTREEAIEALLKPAPEPHRIDSKPRVPPEPTASPSPTFTQNMAIALAFCLLMALILLAASLIVTLFRFFT